MSYPSRGDVKQRYLQTLDSWPQTVTSAFNENTFAPAFNEAFDVLYAEFLKNQVPRVELMTDAQVPPLTTELTPASFGIESFGDYIFLREKVFGSSDKYRDMVSVDVLSQRQPGPYLCEYNWRNNIFYLVGATSLLDVQIKYDDSGQAPTDDDVQIGVDSCLNFLANYAVGVSGGRKGLKETAIRCMALAVGPKYAEGTSGGQLFNLISPLVRSRQKVQISHRPYTTWGRPFSRFGAVPYVAAQQGTTGGGAQNVPIQVSSALGSIIGSIDGINLIFWANLSGVVSMVLYRNGVQQTIGTDYTFVSNQITFAPASVPQPGDILTAEVYVTNNVPA